MPKSLSRLLSSVLLPQQQFARPSQTQISEQTSSRNIDPNGQRSSHQLATTLEHGETTPSSTNSTGPASSSTKPRNSGSLFRLHFNRSRAGSMSNVHREVAHDAGSAAPAETAPSTMSTTEPSGSTKPHNSGSLFRLHFNRSRAGSISNVANRDTAHDIAAAESSSSHAHGRSTNKFSLHNLTHSHAQHHHQHAPLAVSTLGIVGINQRCNDYFYQHMLHLLIQAKQTNFQDHSAAHGSEQHAAHDAHHATSSSNTRSSLTSLGGAPSERPSNTLTSLAASVLRPRHKQKPFKKHWFQNIVMTQQHPYYDEADKAEEDAEQHQQQIAAAAAAAASASASSHNNLLSSTSSADVPPQPPPRTSRGQQQTHPTHQHHHHYHEHEIHERRSDFTMPSVTQLQRLDGLLLLWDKHHHDQIEEPTIGTLAMPSVNQINVSLIENDDVANIPVILLVNMGLTQPRTSTQQRAYLEKVSDMCWAKTMVEKLGASRARIFLWWSDSDVKDAKKILSWLIEARKKTIKLLPNADPQNKWKTALTSTLSTVSSHSSGSSISTTTGEVSPPATSKERDELNSQQQLPHATTSSRRHLYDVVLPPILSYTGITSDTDQSQRQTSRESFGVNNNTSSAAANSLFSASAAQASCSDDNVIHQQHHLPPLPGSNNLDFDVNDSNYEKPIHGRRSAYPQQFSMQITRAPVLQKSLSDDCVIRPDKNKRFIAKIRNWRMNDRRKYSSTHASQVIANNKVDGPQSKIRQQSGGATLTRTGADELLIDNDNNPSQARGSAVVAFRYGSESHTDFSTAMPARHRIAGSQQQLSRMNNNSSNVVGSNDSNANNNVIGGTDVSGGGAEPGSRPAIERRNTVLRQRRQVRRQARARVQEALERARRPMLERRQHLVAAGIVTCSAESPLPPLELTMLAHLTPALNERDGRVSRAKCTFEDTLTGMLYEITVAFSQGLTLGEFAEVRNQMAELMSSTRLSGGTRGRTGGHHHHPHPHHHHRHSEAQATLATTHDVPVIPHTSGNSASVNLAPS